MSPVPLSTTTLKPVTRKNAKAAKHELKVRNANHSASWWDCEDENNVDFEGIVTKTSRVSPLPAGSGMMSLFESTFGLKMGETRLMSAVDDNKKLCLSLTDVQYSFLEGLQEELEKTLVQQVKTLHPKYANSKFVSSVKTSEATGNKYIKSKVQLIGYSRTMGVDMDGSTVSNVPMALSIPGTVIQTRLLISGVYVTKERCGLVTKMDMFRVLHVPSVEEMDKEREERIERLESERVEELKNF